MLLGYKLSQWRIGTFLIAMAVVCIAKEGRLEEEKTEYAQNVVYTASR